MSCKCTTSSWIEDCLLGLVCPGTRHQIKARMVNQLSGWSGSTSSSAGVRQVESSAHSSMSPLEGQGTILRASLRRLLVSSNTGVCRWVFEDAARDRVRVFVFLVVEERVVVDFCRELLLAFLFGEGDVTGEFVCNAFGFWMKHEINSVMMIEMMTMMCRMTSSCVSVVLLVVTAPPSPVTKSTY